MALTSSKQDVAAELARARARSLSLLEPLTEDDLLRQHSPLMSPLVWDLAHVGNYEDLWLVRSLGGVGVGPQYDDIYDAFRHPRRNRPALPLLGPAAAREYIAEVRARAFEVLDGLPGDELPFAYGMVVQHEHQHAETMLATLQLMGGEGYRPKADRSFATGAEPGEVLVPGGTFVMGTNELRWAYDNERPAVEVTLAPYWIDTVPVRNVDYAEFIADGGYDRPSLWTDEGWAWRCAEGLSAPQFWERDGDGRWWRVRFGWREPLPDDEPVQHVCWHEASAYARWKGRRLPTEAEWERAAAGATVDGANLGQARFGPSPVGLGKPSDVGCFDMLGNVWEWTSTSFTGYPGFASFPYREYSEVFFGDEYKLLRGGSWATDPVAVRVTFRNWDYPIRRQIFAGFRCCRDADV